MFTRVPYGHGSSSPASELQFGSTRPPTRHYKGHYQNVISQVMQPPRTGKNNDKNVAAKKSSDTQLCSWPAIAELEICFLTLLLNTSRIASS